MNTLNRILVPVDFSPLSQNGLNQAVQLAMRTNAKLYIFHAYSRPVVPETVNLENVQLNAVQTTYLRKKERQIDDQITEMIEKSPFIGDVDFEVIKKLNNSVSGIVAAVHHYQPDLVVMASKSRHGLDELWGTKTAKVAKQIDVPVLALPDQADLRSLKRIGFACDYGHPMEANSLAYLPLMAQLFRAEIHIINVSDDPVSHGAHEFEQATRLHDMLSDMPHSFDYVFGKNVEKGLVSYCRENNIQLLAIIPHSRSFLEKLFRESLTKQMMYHIDMPLLILK